MSAEIFHTPGPWSAYNDNEGEDPAYMPLWCVANAAYHEPDDGDDPRCFNVTLYTGCEADAHLIAAAPELYAALTRIVMNPEARIGGEMRAEAIAALKKARGKS